MVALVGELIVQIQRITTIIVYEKEFIPTTNINNCFIKLTIIQKIDLKHCVTHH